MFQRRLTQKTLKSLNAVKLLRSRIESELAKLPIAQKAMRICEFGRVELADQRCHGLWAMLYREFELTAWSIFDERPRQRFVADDMARAVALPFRKCISPELFVIGSAAQCLLGANKSREGILTDNEVSDLLGKCSAFTLVSLLYVCGEKNRSTVLVEVKRRFSELDMEDRFLLLKEMADDNKGSDNPVVSAADYIELKKLAINDVDCSVIRKLSTLSLLAFLAVYREDKERRPHFQVTVAAIETALSRPDRCHYDFFAQYVSYVDVIVKKRSLLEAFNSALNTDLREHRRAILILLELSESRIFPGKYLARILLDLKRHLPEIELIYQVYLFVAMCNVGVFESEICETVLASFMDSKTAPEDLIAADYLCHFVASVAIVDNKLGTSYFSDLWVKLEPAFQGLLEDPEIDVILLYRATTSVGIELKGELRNRAISRAHHIEQNRPRNSAPEDRFFALVQDALPESFEVSQSGFAHSYHFDLLVRSANSKIIDLELDDGVHEIHDMQGEELWQRGEDSLRDFVLERREVQVVRMPIDILDLLREQAIQTIKEHLII